MTAVSHAIDKPLFLNSSVASNMPFFDGSTLVFCQSESIIRKTMPNKGAIWKFIRRNPALAEKFKGLPRTQQIRYRAWKLAYCDWQDKIVHAISTGLHGDITERSPTFYREGNQIHLSFIAGTSGSHGPDYRLYTCSGSDFEHLEPATQFSQYPLIFGFVGPHHVCRGIHNIIHLTEKASGNAFQLKTSFHVVSCVAYLADNPAKLLITGKDKKGLFQTVLYDLTNEHVTTISGKAPVYKSTLYKDILIHTRKLEEGYENRQLYLENCKFSESTIKIIKEIS